MCVSVHVANTSSTCSSRNCACASELGHANLITCSTTIKPAATLKEPDEDPPDPPRNELVSTEENTHESDHSSETTGSDSEQHIDLKICTDVKYEKREGVHGVVVRHRNNEQTWTPVYGRRRKRIPLNEVQLRKIPPHCRHPPSSDEDSSSESDIPLTIPEDANVNYTVVYGIPGLSISTRRTRNWTPIASRTRARVKKSATKS